MTMKRCCTNWTSLWVKSLPIPTGSDNLNAAEQRQCGQWSLTHQHNAQFEQIQQDWKKHCALVSALIQQIERTLLNVHHVSHVRLLKGLHRRPVQPAQLTLLGNKFTTDRELPGHTGLASTLLAPGPLGDYTSSGVTWRKITV
jgi:hypothetical protein